MRDYLYAAQLLSAQAQHANGKCKGPRIEGWNSLGWGVIIVYGSWSSLMAISTEEEPYCLQVNQEESGVRMVD